MMKRIISIALALLLLASCAAVSAAAADVPEYVVRIEGATKNIATATVSANDIENVDLENVTVADVLKAVNKNDNIDIVGIENGYVSEINGEKAGQFGGWDGWYYAVNGNIADKGIADYKVTGSSDIVLYYGGFPCQYPVGDYSKAAMGVMTFNSYDAEYDAEGNATYDWAPVAGATVTLNGDEYTTDEIGMINYDTAKYEGIVKVQISKTDASGAPAVCRFSENESVTFAVKPTSDTTAKTVQTLKITCKESYAVSEKKLSNKSVSFKAVKASANGKVSCKITKISKKTKKITISKNGKITLKKGLKKGNYTVTVKVTAAATKKFLKKSSNVKIKIKVKK